MNERILHPRMLLFLVFAASTTVWLVYKPLFSFQKYVSVHAILNYLAFYALIFAVCFVTEKTRLARRPETFSLERFRSEHADGRFLRREALALALVAFAAQLVWIVRIVQYAGVPKLAALIAAQDFLTFKEQIVNATGISGITTFTQIGIVASALYSIYVFGLRRRGSFGMWALILFPGVLRGLFFSERIALLEAAAPIVVLAIFFGRIRVTVPKLIAGALAIVLFFSSAEGLRSYQVYSKNGVAQDGVYGYGVSRLLDYVSSSVNHSMAMADLSGRTFGFPTLMFNGWINFLYTFVPKEKLQTFLQTEQSAAAYQNVKASPYSAADYTNMGFFGEIFMDAGYLYILYAIVYGWLIGMTFKGARKFEIGWLALYPTVAFSLLESYRVPYLFDIRMFYPLLYLVCRYLFLSFYRSRAARPAAGRLAETGQRLSGVVK